MPVVSNVVEEVVVGIKEYLEGTGYQLFALNDPLSIFRETTELDKFSDV